VSHKEITKIRATQKGGGDKKLGYMNMSVNYLRYKNNFIPFFFMPRYLLGFP
jgi:hypothetical protein